MRQEAGTQHARSDGPAAEPAAAAHSVAEGQSPAAAESTRRPTLSTTRLEAFSDGVFAVAITLLIFGISTPLGRQGKLLDNGALLPALGAEWASYASYVVSFLTIGIMWVNHHGMFSRIRTVNRPLLFLNLLLLMTVAFIPFPTNVLGTYVVQVHGGKNASVAAALYGATMTVMSICFVAIWAYAVYGGLLDPERIDLRRARASIPRFGMGLVIYAATIGIAFVNPELDLLIFGLLALFYVFDQLNT